MKKRKKEEDRTGIFVPAGLFLGLGMGFITGELVGWLFVGMGLGFLAMALSKPKKAKK